MEAQQGLDTVNATLAPKYAQLLEAIGEAERASASKKRAAKDAKQAELEMHERLAAEAKQATELVRKVAVFGGAIATSQPPQRAPWTASEGLGPPALH